MKCKTLLLTLFVACSFQIKAQESPHRNQNESPYFEVRSKQSRPGDMPLLSTKAVANISGPIANVVVTQTYQNNGKYPIEAVYVFPASTRSAVYDMKMKIGDRVINADIQEKQKAINTYNEAKKEGKRASLLQQHRPNVFQMQVANILPGDLIEVVLKYNELLIPENQIYSFVYPTVVGPRYGGAKPNDPSSSSQLTYTNDDSTPSYDFDIEVYLNAGMPIQESISPSHKVDINYNSLTTATVALKPSDRQKGNKDFIYNYTISGDSIATGTMLYEHDDEKFFLSMVHPPRHGTPMDRPNKEYIFVVDVSGSMYGFPIDISKKLMKSLIGNLTPKDKFNVLLFAGGSKVLANTSLSATSANLDTAFKFIDQENGGGGTELLPALERALALPNNTDDLSRTIVVVTDGYVNVERETFHTIANNLGTSNLFAFGIGSSVNRHIIEGMANAGQGEAFIITEEKYSQRAADKFEKYISNPVLTNIKVNYQGFEAYDVTPFSFPDLMAERPLYVFGKYKGNPQGKIVINGNQGPHVFNHSIDIKQNLVSPANSPIRYLWAREKIRWLDDLNTAASSKEDVESITALGLKYNLLTKYTSFVAVEELQVLANDRTTKRINQSLPLPHGVSNHAVGFELLIEGTTEKNECEEKLLFVHVSGKLAKNKKSLIKDLLSNKILFDQAEKKFLDNNTVQIKYDKSIDQWTILGLKYNLSQKFIDQLIGVLSNIEGLEESSFTAEINLLWV